MAVMHSATENILENVSWCTYGSRNKCKYSCSPQRWLDPLVLPPTAEVRAVFALRPHQRLVLPEKRDLPVKN